MELGHLLSHISKSDDPNILVGFDTADDAGVYRVREDLALVQTVDIITPICDDPYWFGQVAAANALSDVYAMGGRPLTALNICCFPASGVPEGVYGEILRGALDKIHESGAALVGGHSVRDPELKYGLSVTGTIHPDRILTNAGARAGDRLVITKPLGTGFLVGAARKDLIGWEDLLPAVEIMARLNAAAAELALSHGAHACTDITGFGLAGHALEVARASHVSLRLRASALPLYDRALQFAGSGVTTALTASNRALAGTSLVFREPLAATLEEIFFDPQTSGGLLISVPASRADSLVAGLRGAGCMEAAQVGEVITSEEPMIEVFA